MELPLKTGTLIYFFDDQNRVLLMRRRKEPNMGLWSPPGGKVLTHFGESPFQGAIREANEETGVLLHKNQLHLCGFISESAYQSSAHWHIFLFEALVTLLHKPPVHDEGEFDFFHIDRILSLDIPETDREFIWPALLEHRGGFFSAHCQSSPKGNLWTLEQSVKPKNSASHKL
jgi:8-oxo-dGTP diphosphatase